ncbi:MAG: 4Fe-4S ferredoxin [Chloroflexi bacterium HGW-Chloroflexi-1]|nr:MAG: 4Fe-4S ferredoxin [Chloroflexi bacterium HGW-Chloroflexi-1]
MVDHVVYVVRCSDYGQAAARLGELFGMLGGVTQFVRPGERIVLKANLVRPARPESAVITHPAVVAGVGRAVRAAGAIPVLADSPGGGYPYNEQALDALYRLSGLHAAAAEAGIVLNRDTTWQTVPFPAGHLIKRFEITTPVRAADGVFNLCKLKTHVFMGLSGAVKNSFGVIPGLAKAGYHARLHDPRHFANMLLDLDAFLAPRLTIMDAVIGMEGEGPSAGTPRGIGLLLASTSALAVDVVASEIVGLRRERNPVLMAAEHRGLQPSRIEHVTLVGATLDDLRVPGFKLPATARGGAGVSRWQEKLMPMLRRAVTVRPTVIEAVCVGCGACADACPVGAITLNGASAVIDERACIRCYCCHEMCPETAIVLQEGWLYRWVSRG